MLSFRAAAFKNGRLEPNQRSPDLRSQGSNGHTEAQSAIPDSLNHANGFESSAPGRETQSQDLQKSFDESGDPKSSPMLR